MTLWKQNNELPLCSPRINSAWNKPHIFSIPLYSLLSWRLLLSCCPPSLSWSAVSAVLLPHAHGKAFAHCWRGGSVVEHPGLGFTRALGSVTSQEMGHSWAAGSKLLQWHEGRSAFSVILSLLTLTAWDFLLCISFCSNDSESAAWGF